MSSESSSFLFDISPEPRFVDVDVSEGNFVDVIFLVQNRSHRPIRVEAIPYAVSAPENASGSALAPELWQGWLQVIDENDKPLIGDIHFEDTSVKHIRVRVTLPERVIDGAYQLRLVIVGVEDPDEEFAASDLVTLNVTGPKLNVRRFVVIALIVLAVIILLAVGAAFLLRPRPRLTVQLTAPANVTMGEVAEYSVSVKNERQSDAQNVTLEYSMPDGVIGATAFVPNALYRYCEETERTIVCDLGTIPANATQTVTIDAIAGPFPQATTGISNTRTTTVTSRLDDQVSITPADVPIEVTRILTPTELSVAIDPSVGTAVIEEAVTYRLLAWNNITDTETLSLTFHLPPKMHYVNPLPRNCDQLDDYFTLICTHDGLRYDSARPEFATFLVNAVPSDTSTGFAAKITDVGFESARTQAQPEDPDAPDQPAATGGTIAQPAVSVSTRAVNSALQFNGISDYAELGYNRAPTELTVEAWVHPFSTSDGQSFIGAHREPEGEADVENIFLVGYWEDGLHINVGGDSHELLDSKRVGRFHLAVTVRQLDSETSEVRVYINGELADQWSEDGEFDDSCDGCKIFNGALDGDKTLNWVLGQDWDPGSQGRTKSDYFHGALSDVRIWETVRGRDAIAADMNVRPQVGSEGLVANWRLEPLDPQSNVLADRVSTANNGERHGADWGEPVARFGSALLFDGLTDGLYGPPQVEESWQLPQFDTTRPISATVSAWVLVDAIPSEEQLITAVYSNKLIGMGIDSDGQVVVVTQEPGNDAWVSLKDEQPIQAGRWVHYAAVFSPDRSDPTAQEIALYRNGREIKNLRMADNPLQSLETLLNQCAPGTYLGGPAGPCETAFRFHFAGRLDEVRFWDRVLGEDEINSWRNLPDIMYNEVAYWSFDDSPGRGGTRPLDCLELAPPDSQTTCGFHFVATPDDPDFDGFELWLPLPVAGPAWIDADSRIEQQFLDRQ